jgi:hypothetical protein
MPVALVDANLGQPGIQAGSELELAQFLESGQKNLLEDVLDFRVVGPHEVHAKAVELLVVELVELKLGLFLTLQDPLD